MLARLAFNRTIMMRKILVAGNWKMHGSKTMVSSLLYVLLAGSSADGKADLVVFPPFPYLSLTESILSGSHIHWGGQSLNPNAQFPFKITSDQVLKSPMVSDPLRLLDCSPITDGAAAVLITTLEEAKKLKKQPVFISGIGHASDSIALSSRKDILKLEAVELSTDIALKMAGKSIRDIDFAEVHDCFSIAEIMILEALGVVAPGEGGKASSDGLTGLNGDFPVNPSGGLKSKGHPVGATGVAQICEAVTQLRGEAGERQLKNIRTGLTQNMGGSAGSSVVHILEVI